MFYTHSSLLERAGKLNRNHKTLTALPIVLAAGGDITAYLPTNVMSITDGQWILDMKVFRDSMRPAVSTGLSVTRVGGLGLSKRQKVLAQQITLALNAYVVAAEFSHFGAELTYQSMQDLAKGKRLYELFNQAPDETYTVNAQVLMIDIALNLAEGEMLDVHSMKAHAEEVGAKMATDADFDKCRDELKPLCVKAQKGSHTELKPAAATPEQPAAQAEVHEEPKPAQESKKGHEEAER
jgi:F-type H+-transporting ATPase subunit alpha